MISRRNFLRAIAAATVLYPLKSSSSPIKTERSLNLYNVHTDEDLDLDYFVSGAYDFEALERINYFMRCPYTNEVKPMDIRILDLLCDIKDSIGKKRQLNIISGYRSPEYNEYLRSHGRRIAKESLHMQGLAIDFSIEGVSRRKTYRVARSFFAGGVGRYRKFVHIDVGPVRYW